MNRYEQGSPLPFGQDQGLDKEDMLTKMNLAFNLILFRPQAPFTIAPETVTYAGSYNWPKLLHGSHFPQPFYKSTGLGESYLRNSLRRLMEIGVIQTTNRESKNLNHQNRFCLQPYDFLAGVAVAILNKEMWLTKRGEKGHIKGIVGDVEKLVAAARDVLPEDHVVRGFIHDPTERRLSFLQSPSANHRM